MRRFIVILSVFLIACQVFSLAPAILQTSPTVTPSLLQSPAPTATATPELVPSPTPLQSTATVPAVQPSHTGENNLATGDSLTTEVPFATPGAAPQDHSITVLFHPEGALYVGDQVSMEVIAPPESGLKGRKVSLLTGGPSGQKLAEASFEPNGLGGRLQATFLWSWDTSALPAGQQNVTFSVQPDGPTWMETVTLLPRGQLPPEETQATWATAKSACCVVHYLTHTPAERDLSSLLAMMDDQAAKVSQQLGAHLTEPASVVLIPRLIGHGGFTGREIVLSYLDRNYIDGDFAVIFHHELVHLMDARLGGDLKPSLLVEGLAVYLSGGHYLPGPLLPRLAALLPPEPGCLPAEQALSARADQAGSPPICGLNRYLPLEDLFNNFYFAQHEIGYLEAGSLVKFMVDTWGWTAFSSFYRDIHPATNTLGRPGGKELSQSRAVDDALQRHFGLTLAQLEARFLQTLKAQPVRAQDVEDIRLTVRYYDSVRRYQQLLDPSAYFLNAWLPDSEQMRQRKIVADVMRSPTGPKYSALETMFISANGDIQQGRYLEAQRLLDVIEVILNGVSPFAPQEFE